MNWKLLSINSFLLILALLLLLYSAHTGNNSALLNGLSYSIITAALMSFTIDRYSVQAQHKNLTDMIDRRLSGHSLSESGVIRTRVGFPLDDIYKEITRSEAFVVVQTWHPDGLALLDAAKKLVRNNGKFELFILHPHSIYCIGRDRTLGNDNYSQKHIENQISSMKDAYESLINEHGLDSDDVEENFRLYLYESMPSAAIYMSMKSIWFGLFWLGKQAARGFAVEICRRTENFPRSDLENQIEKLRAKSCLYNLKENSLEPIRHPLPRKL